jgi:hypothetical protein
MIKINLKVQFIFLAISIFFIGVGITEIIQQGVKSGVDLLEQLSTIITFIFSSFIFIRSIYGNKNKHSYNY